MRYGSGSKRNRVSGINKQSPLADSLTRHMERQADRHILYFTENHKVAHDRRRYFPPRPSGDSQSHNTFKDKSSTIYHNIVETEYKDRLRRLYCTVNDKAV